MKARSPRVLASGDKVLIQGGPLAGVSGEVLRVKDNRRLVIRITLLKCIAAVELADRWIAPDPAEATERLSAS